MEYIKQIKIGKEAFESYIDQRHNNMYGLTATAEKYQIKLSEVYECISLYRKRVVAPKPTEEEERKYKSLVAIQSTKHLDLNNIINEALNADNEANLKRLLNKYDINTLRNTLREYAYNVLEEDRDESHRLIAQRLDQIDALLINKQTKSTNKIKEIEETITVILKEYMDSDEIYPDIFVKKYLKTQNIFILENYLTNYAKRSDTNAQLVTNYKEELNKRVSAFVNDLEDLFKEFKNKKINTLDIEMLTGQNLKTVKTFINRKACTDKYGVSYCREIYNIINRSWVDYNTILTKEEAYNLVCSYQNFTMTKKDVDEIYRFFQKYNLTFSLSNIRAAYIKLIDYDLEPTLKMKYIIMAKDSFEHFINNEGKYHALTEMANKYMRPTDEIKKAISYYRFRVLPPKPTKEQIKAYQLLNSNRYYEYLDNIIPAIINAKTNQDLESIVKKYDWIAIRNSVREFLYKDTENQELKKLISEKYNYMDNYRSPEAKTPSRNKNSRQTNVDAIIDEYIESDDIFPDKIIQKYYKGYKVFNNTLKLYAENNEDNYKKVVLFNKVKEEKINKLMERIKELALLVDKKEITPLDIQLRTQMTLKELKALLNRKDVYEKLGGKSTAVNIINYIDRYAGDIRKYTEEEALNLHYNYNGAEMTEEHIKTIIHFLTKHNLPLTYSNICYGFIKLTNKELQDSKTIE